MEIRKVTCVDGTSFYVGQNIFKGTIKSIFIQPFALIPTMYEIIVRVSGEQEDIHIPFHSVLLFM